jgi:hypothetical protein
MGRQIHQKRWRKNDSSDGPGIWPLYAFGNTEKATKARISLSRLACNLSTDGCYRADYWREKHANSGARGVRYFFKKNIHLLISFWVGKRLRMSFRLTSPSWPVSRAECNKLTSFKAQSNLAPIFRIGFIPANDSTLTVPLRI